MSRAWDDLVAHLDALAATDTPLDPRTVTDLKALVVAGQAEGIVDAELHPAATARALAAWVAGVRFLRTVPGGEEDLETARLVVTRWLHPARVDVWRGTGGRRP